MFDSMNLHPQVLKGVVDAGYTEPSPIQRDSIPAAAEGRDVLACAPTGSGKTAAFVLPILHRILNQPRKGHVALVLTPTRELALQIEEQIRRLGKHTGVRSATIFGGVGMGAQRRAFETGVPILVATPGRLLDHLNQGYASLSQVSVLVLDEADRMLDMGFMPDIKRILQHLTGRSQTLFFSATMPSEIADLTHKLLKNPLTINLKRQGEPAKGITQKAFEVPNTAKNRLLLSLVAGEDVRNALVFTRTKRRADRVADFLHRQGVASARIHGDRTQGQRTQALDGFKRGRYKVLVATDVAARGIDVDSLSHVINFDLPGSAEDYIHRIGRTARANATGDAWTFVTPEDRSEFRQIERRLPGPVPRGEVSTELLNSPEPQPEHAHQPHKAPQRDWDRGQADGSQPAGDEEFMPGNTIEAPGQQRSFRPHGGQGARGGQGGRSGQGGPRQHGGRGSQRPWERGNDRSHGARGGQGGSGGGRGFGAKVRGPVPAFAQAVAHAPRLDSASGAGMPVESFDGDERQPEHNYSRPIFDTPAKAPRSGQRSNYRGQGGKHGGKRTTNRHGGQGGQGGGYGNR